MRFRLSALCVLATCGFLVFDVVRFAVPLLANRHDQDGGAILSVAWFESAGSVSSLMVAVPLGRFVDRHYGNRLAPWLSVIVVYCSGASLLIVAAMLGARPGLVLSTLLLTVGQLAVSVWFQKSVGTIVADEQLSVGHGGLLVARGLSLLLAPNAAAFLYQRPATLVVSIIFASAIVGAGGSQFASRPPGAEIKETPGLDPRSWIDSLRADGRLGVIVASAGVWNLGVIAFHTLFVLYVVNDLGRTAEDAGAAASLAGVGVIAGGVLGAVVSPRAFWHRATLAILAMILVLPSAGYLAAQSSVSFTAAAISALLIGAVGGLVGTHTVAELQRLVPEKQFGSVLALVFVASNATEPAGAWLSALGSSTLGLAQSIAVVMLVLAVSIVILTAIKSSGASEFT